jgi:hypothetical protein
MTISSEQLAVLGSLGYTPEEARFLAMVATHSGYFVARQLVAFTRAGRGKRVDHFAKKIKSRGHAGWREYPRLGGVYHLSSKTIYRVMDREGLHTVRRHATELIRTRLLALDFVLANQAHRYLETEPEKIAYFCEQLGVPRDALPVKVYGRPAGREPVVRYFTDNFPLFLDHSADLLPTFSYVNPGVGSFAGLARHLSQYAKLFVHLPEFRFLYISDSPAHFLPAERCFRSFAKRVLEHGLADDLSRYFRLRAAWDQKQYERLTNEDVEWLEAADARFRGPDTERRYAAWSAGQGLQQGLARPVDDAQPTFCSCFRTCLVLPAPRISRDDPVVHYQEETHGPSQETT